MRRLILAVMLAVPIVMTAATGCRPDDTTEGPDTTAVFETDTLVEDSIETGIWGPDTVITSVDTLAVHQQRLKDVFFEFDRSELTEQALDTLMYDASYILDHQGFRVLLEGHCDERGTIDYNLALGERRAMAVYDYLIEYGVDASRLQTVSYGKERPFALGHDEQSWAKNRRVHFRVLPTR